MKFSIVKRITLLLLATLLTFSNTAVSDADIETRIKAAFLYKFCFYVEWPGEVFTSATAPLIIAIAGEESLATELRQIVSGHQVNNRSIEVRRIQKGDSLRGIHVLFISGKIPWRNTLLATTNAAPILTVTDAASGNGENIIEFVVADERVKFDIFLAPAQQAGLTLGSELLSVARTVRKDGLP